MYPSIQKLWIGLSCASCGPDIMTTIFLPVFLLSDNKSNAPHFSSSDVMRVAHMTSGFQS